MADTPVPLSTLRTGGDKQQPSALVDWANPPSLATLQADLTAARTNTQSHITNIIEYRQTIAGGKKRKERKGRSTVQPKTVRGQLEWRYASLSEAILSAPEMFQTSPRTFEDVKAAQQHKLLLNWQFDTKLQKVPLVDAMVRVIADTGTMALRVGWRRVEEEVTQEVPAYEFYAIETDEQMAAFNQVVEAYNADPSQLEVMPPELAEAVRFYLESNQPTVAVQNGMTVSKVMRAVINQPTLEVIDSQNLYIDPTCLGKWWEARFMIYTFESSKAELMEDGRYSNLDAVDWASINTKTQDGPQTPTSPTANFSDALRRRVPIFEYTGDYDIHGDGKLHSIIATWVGDILIRMELNPHPDKRPPFIIVPFMPTHESAYGEPDAALMKDNQEIIGATVRGMIDLMGRSANGQTGIAKQFLDTPNRAKYNAGEDYEFNPTMQPSTHIFAHKYPEVPASAFNMLQYFTQQNESLTGTKAFTEGLTSASYGDVAAGTRGVMSAAAQRESAIMRRIKFGMSMVGQKIAEMNKIFLSDEEIIRVTNEANIAVRREDLLGGVDVSVNITSAAENDARASELSFMLQASGGKDPMIGQMILAEIARLRRMPEFAHRIENYKPEPDPMQVRLQELEAARLESEIEVNRAKVASLLGTARKANSEADKKDLDFVEDQTGVTHQRAMEQTKAQAAGNEKLELTKGLVEAGKVTGDFGPAMVHANLPQQ